MAPGTSSSRKKKRRVVLEDSDDDSSSDEAIQMKISSPTPNTTRQPRTPSSAGSVASTSFRLNCRVRKPKSANTTTIAPKRSTTQSLKRNRPTGRRSDPASSSPSSDSSSLESEPEARRQNSRQPRRGKQKTTKTPPRRTTLLDSSSSDSDSDSSVEVVEQKKKPFTTQSKQKPFQNRHGIDPSLVASDSDDDSIRVPATNSLTIITKTRKQPASKAKADGMKPVNRKTNPPLAAKKQPRKPPAQPKRASKMVAKKKSDDNSVSSSSSASSESSNLRHVARKCAALPHTPSPKPRHQGVDSNNRDNPPKRETNSRLLESDESDCEIVLKKFTDKESATNKPTIRSVDANNLFKRKSPTKSLLESDESDCEIVLKKSTLAKEKAPNAKKPTLRRDTKNKSRATRKDGDTDESGDESNPKNPNNDGDDDYSVDTAELTENLKLNFGLPVEEEAPKEEEAPPGTPSPDACKHLPASNDGASSNAIQQNKTTDSARAVRQPPEQNEEFVLQHIASSSSSSSSESSRGGDNRETHKTGPIPSVIGVPISTTAGHNASVVAHPSRLQPSKPTNVVPSRNPYLRKTGATSNGANDRRDAAAAARLSSPSRTGGGNPNNASRGQLVANQGRPRSSNYEDDEDFEEIFLEGIATTEAAQNPFAQFEGPPRHAEHQTRRQSAPLLDANARQNQELDVLEDEAFFQGAAAAGNDVVDLCQDDVDNRKQAASRTTTVHQGLRVPTASPEFNRRSRDFSTGARTNAPVDDIEEFPEDQPFRHGRPRRVTDITSSNGPPLNFQATLSSNNYRPHQLAVKSPVDRRQGRQSLLRPDAPKEWNNSQQAAKRRRIRDASNSNPFHARSVTSITRRQNETQQDNSSIRPTNDENVYYRQNGHNNNSNWSVPWNHQANFYHQQPLRNDLAGGSGVGAGGYSIVDDYDDDNENDYDYSRSAGRGRGRGGGRSRSRAASTGRSSRGKGGGGKKWKGKSKSRSGWGGKRGRGGRYTKRGGKGGRSSRPGGVMESAGADPLLQHVGGADITF